MITIVIVDKVDDVTLVFKWRLIAGYDWSRIVATEGGWCVKVVDNSTVHQYISLE
jgi:hypothetical protein